jgi:hypothetical protein
MKTYSGFFFGFLLLLVASNVFSQQISNTEYEKKFLSISISMKKVSIGSTILIFDSTAFNLLEKNILTDSVVDPEAPILRSKTSLLAAYYHEQQGTFSDDIEIRDYGSNIGSSGVSGKLICITSNNYIYIRDKSYYSHILIEKKYTYDGTDYKEAPQPFYYIGAKSKTNTDVNIYDDINAHYLVATIAKDTEVDVIGLFENPYDIKFDGFWLLLMGKTGIIGWHKASFLPKKEGQYYAQMTGTIDLFSGLYMP